MCNLNLSTENRKLLRIRFFSFVLHIKFKLFCSLIIEFYCQTKSYAGKMIIKLIIVINKSDLICSRVFRIWNKLYYHVGEKLSQKLLIKSVVKLLMNKFLEWKLKTEIILVQVKKGSKIGFLGSLWKYLNFANYIRTQSMFWYRNFQKKIEWQITKPPFQFKQPNLKFNFGTRSNNYEVKHKFKLFCNEHNRFNSHYSCILIYNINSWLLCPASEKLKLEIPLIRIFSIKKTTLHTVSHINSEKQQFN